MSSEKIIEIQGHRGARSIYPENTIPAFIYALQQGVTTLEMDVVITKDSQVMLSHEPFMSHEICLDTLGNMITEANEKTYNIFQLTYRQVQQYDCGVKKHPRFLEQKKMTVKKPLLRDVMDSVEKYIAANNLPKVQYNIETKTTVEGDGIFHPAPSTFVDVLLQEIISGKIQNRTTIQSFDIRTLQYLHQKMPAIKTVLLVENTLSPQENIQLLGFTPTIYSPHFSLVNKSLTDYCQQQSMQLITWTVNDTATVQKLLSFPLQGIITDNPKLIIDYLKKQHYIIAKPQSL